MSPMKILVRICASSPPGFFASLAAFATSPAEEFNDFRPTAKKERSRVVIVSDTLRSACFPNQMPSIAMSTGTKPVWNSPPGSRLHRAQSSASPPILTICMQSPSPWSTTVYTPFQEGPIFWRAPFHSSTKTDAKSIRCRPRRSTPFNRDLSADHRSSNAATARRTPSGLLTTRRTGWEPLSSRVRGRLSALAMLWWRRWRAGFFGPARTREFGSACPCIAAQENR